MKELIKATFILTLVFIIICMPSCLGHSNVDIEHLSDYFTRVDSLDDTTQTPDNTGGIILDIGDTIMDEETETIIFHSQEWDEVDSDVDL